MRLKSLKYTEQEGSPQEWTIEGLTLAQSNLIVGKNASGKSRTLNVLSGLAKHLIGVLPPTGFSSYECEFIDGTDIYKYQVDTKNDSIVLEKLSLNNQIMLDRGADGEGTIKAEQIADGTSMRFQTPTNQFAAVARRDSIQHKFLEPLYQWASSLRHYYFGTSLGKENFAIFVPKGIKVDERDPNAIVGLFKAAQKEYGDTFIESVKRDLARVDYSVTNVGLAQPVSIRVLGAPGELMGLYVNETDLPGITDQHSMSQGMFRTLALLIHLNYYQLKKSATCILVDDIGEGLDFDRSCRLIDLLREKATSQNVQLIMSTNDRFVMNRVPLDEWSILQRKKNHVFVKNYGNSKEIFEDFKFTGLSNFSFLELDIINEPPLK